MKNLIKSILICMLVVGCNKTESPDKQITKEIILDNYYKAIGGYDNLKNIKTLKKTGTYIEPKYNLIGFAGVDKKRPNLRVISALGEEGAPTVMEGYNGSVGWEYFKGSDIVFSEGEAKRVILRGAEFDFPFIDADEKGHVLTYQGITNLDGIYVYTLRVKFEDDFIDDFYFDTKTFLVLGHRKTQPIHAVGKDYNIVEHYSNFKSVNGVLFPFNFIERDQDTGKFLNAVIIHEISANVDFPSNHFDPPIHLVKKKKQ